MQSKSIGPGRRLGPYEVVSLLGAGGMGEVWSARDTRLDRSVAIKVLPAELAQNAQFRLRFEREAKTISQLAHPHICTLFDVGDGFLVMELLEGETLSNRIARGPMPVSDVLRYGAQIAEALAGAHRMGIVHRDLKPANVMITKSGAKLLDFGLAKPGGNVVDVDGATQQRGLTQEGTILGTFEYMAPEQLEGLEADARTDIFALGALLYEMATGQRAFQGRTRTSLIAAIVSAQPAPISQFQPIAPPAFEHVVNKCLSKEPDDRWQSARDIAEQLRWIEATGGAIQAATAKTSKLPWIAAAAIFVVATAVIGFLVRRTSQPRVLWTDLASPSGVRLFSPEDRGGCAIAPDGGRIVFVGQDAAGASRIYLRDLRSGDVRPIPGTEGATYPFWSPDSRSIAYFADGKLKRIDADGTRAAIVAENVDGRGGTWGPDGTIVYAPSTMSALARVRASGGKSELFTKVGPDQISHRFPSFLPDGKHVLFTALGESAGRGIHVASLDGSLQRRLLDTPNSGVFCRGFVVYIEGGALYARKIDVGEVQLRGDPIQIASGASGSASQLGDSGLSATPSGALLFPGPFETKSALVWRDRSGAPLQSVVAERLYEEPSLSPDGKRLAAVATDRLWEIDLERGRSRQLFESANMGSATWWRDGNVAFNATHEARNAILAVSSSGGEPKVVATMPQALFLETFSPDGAFAVLNGPAAGEQQFNLWSLNLANRQILPFVSGPGHQARTQFSPDGRFFVYTSDETGRPELFLQTNPPTGAKWQVTFNGGDQAFWRGDGREILYLGPDAKMMSIAVTPGETPAFGDPVALFRTALTPTSMTGFRNQYVVSRDGRRFLLLETAHTAPSHYTLITNFPELVAAR